MAWVRGIGLQGHLLLNHGSHRVQHLSSSGPTGPEYPCPLWVSFGAWNLAICVMAYRVLCPGTRYYSFLGCKTHPSPARKHDADPLCSGLTGFSSPLSSTLLCPLWSMAFWKQQCGTEMFARHRFFFCLAT